MLGDVGEASAFRLVLEFQKWPVFTVSPIPNPKLWVGALYLHVLGIADESMLVCTQYHISCCPILTLPETAWQVSRVLETATKSHLAHQCTQRQQLGMLPCCAHASWTCCRGNVRDSLHGDKLKRRQKELRSWAEGAASLHVLNQLGTTVDEFLQVHLVHASIVLTLCTC